MKGGNSNVSLSSTILSEEKVDPLFSYRTESIKVQKVTIIRPRNPTVDELAMQTNPPWHPNQGSSMYVDAFPIGPLQPSQTTETSASTPAHSQPVANRGILRTVSRFCIVSVIGVWQFFCLVILLAVTASIPILQFASLGYLLESAGRWARGERLRNCLPGLKQAGYIGTAFVWIGVTSIPVFIIRDLAGIGRVD